MGYILGDRKMTDEEMAEEYAYEKWTDYPEKQEIAEQAFLAGLKAGRPQWHKVAERDLPKEDKQYLVLFYYNYKGKKEMSYGVRNNLHSDFEIHRGYTEQIIAWCEIPTFDKE